MIMCGSADRISARRDGSMPANVRSVIHSYRLIAAEHELFRHAGAGAPWSVSAIVRSLPEPGWPERRRQGREDRRRSPGCSSARGAAPVNRSTARRQRLRRFRAVLCMPVFGGKPKTARCHRQVLVNEGEAETSSQCTSSLLRRVEDSRSSFRSPHLPCHRCGALCWRDPRQDPAVPPT